jgi:hypothetical protein
LDLTRAAWVRPDGVQIVKASSDLSGSGTLIASLSQSADGTYRSSPVYTGAMSPSAPGTTDSTCKSWTSGTDGSSTYEGIAGATAAQWFNDGPSLCLSADPVYCLEK